MSTTRVSDMLDLAVETALDYLVMNDGSSARLCVRGKQHPTWIIFDRASDGSFYARTNDIDLMCATPPSFYKSDFNSTSLKFDVVQYLEGEFSGIARIDVQVFREPKSGHEPILEGNSDDGAPLKDQVVI